MTADPIEVLRSLPQKWRGLANDAMRRSGTWSGNDMADRIGYMADELESALVSLSAPKHKAGDHMGAAPSHLVEGSYGGLCPDCREIECTDACMAGEVFGPKALSTMVALERPLPPGTKLYTAPPRPEASAPVGVGGLPGEIRNLASEFTDEGGAPEVMREWADRLERALAQQPAPVAPARDSLLQTALRNLPQYISKSGLVGPDKHSAMQCFEVLRDALAQQPAAPKINIECETRNNGITGSTSLEVIRVEQEDDGSWTAVTNHWPWKASEKNQDREHIVEVFPNDMERLRKWLSAPNGSLSLDRVTLESVTHGGIFIRTSPYGQQPQRRSTADEEAYAAGYVSFRSMKQCTDAWLAVVYALDAAYPDWDTGEGTAQERAVASINMLGRRYRYLRDQYNYAAHEDNLMWLSGEDFDKAVDALIADKGEENNG